MSTTRTSDHYEPLLGTVVEIDLELDGVGREPEADVLSTAIAEEMVRLQSILSSVDPDSEFSRWCRSEHSDTSPELAEMLALAADWQRRSQGRFTPAAGRLTRLWRAAELDGREPDPAELAPVVAEIAEARWSVVDGVAVRLGDTTDCTLNALAKGWIADRALAIATTADGVIAATINAGGDIVTGGRSERHIGIEDPRTPWDNAPPLTTIVLRDAGLATSGGARRGFHIDGVLHSHVLDPRTGRPVDDVASISVVAPTAAEADVLATVLGVEPAADALSEATAMGLACLVVTADGQVLATEEWRRLEIN